MKTRINNNFYKTTAIQLATTNYLRNFYILRYFFCFKVWVFCAQSTGGYRWLEGIDWYLSEQGLFVAASVFKEFGGLKTE